MTFENTNFIAICHRCSRAIFKDIKHVCDESEAELTAAMNSAKALVEAKEKVVEEAVKLMKSERWPYLLGGGYLAHAVKTYEELLAKAGATDAGLHKE